MTQEHTQPNEGGKKKESPIRKEILIAIFIGFLTYALFDPLTKLLWNWILVISTGTFQGYVNSIYKSAALGHRNYIDVLLIWIAYAAGIGAILLTAVFDFRYSPRGKAFREGKVAKLINKYWSKFTIAYLVLMVILFGSDGFRYFDISLICNSQLHSSKG